MPNDVKDTDFLEEDSFAHNDLSARRQQRRRDNQRHKSKGKDVSSHYKGKKSAMRLRDRDYNDEEEY